MTKSKFKTRKFSKEFLQDAIHGDAEGTEEIETTIEDTSRWSIQKSTVFSFEGKFYEAYYQVGATEMQDEMPFEYDNDEIEVCEVEKVEVVKHEWRGVEE